MIYPMVPRVTLDPDFKVMGN